MKHEDPIDEALLRELQELAAISLSEEESLALREKLRRVVVFLAEIDAVEIPDPPPEEPRTVLRGDLCRPSLPSETVLRAAPDHEGSFFRVLPALPSQGGADSEGERGE
jgi:aspartyl-tRNA(Asn)/glutamyl-tRNA(Gln) amidotransferase subunit C